MTKPDYFVEIHAAQTAGQLHELRLRAQTDGDLTQADFTRIAEAIGKKFARLNHETLGHQKPRWGGGATANHKRTH